MAKIHFTAEGEVTFKSILFVPKSSPNDMFQNYGKKMEGIKVRNFETCKLVDREGRVYSLNC
jgi:HSP90 family molecular chaperone